jgi:hypothetical protein
MFRKTLIALGAIVTLSAAALAPTSASAWHHHHWHGHGWGWGAFGAGFATGLIATSAYAQAPGCYIVRRWIDTPYGLKLRRVMVCG